MNLTMVDLGDNQFKKLPFMLSLPGALPRLESLILDHNYIIELSGQFLSNMATLRTFVISFSRISYIEAGFFTSSHLTYLDLNGSNIARLGVGVLPLSVEFTEISRYSQQ